MCDGHQDADADCLPPPPDPDAGEVFNAAAHREYQRGNRCPFIPRDEWGYRTRTEGPDGSDVFKPDDACPGAYARTGAASEAYRALRWADRGALRELYPHGTTRIVQAAIDVMADVRAAWREERQRLLDLEREERRKRDE